MKYRDMTPEQKEARKAYLKKYKDEHREELNAYHKKYKDEHREELNAYHKKYNAEHREEYKAYQRNYHDEHKEEYKAYRKNSYAKHQEERKYRLKKRYGEDLNKNGVPKGYIRTVSNGILKKVHGKLDGYEIHHCFGYEYPNKFIYIPKYLHTQIHRLLRDNNIQADSNHWNAIRDLVNSCEDYTYIRT